MRSLAENAWSKRVTYWLRVSLPGALKMSWFPLIFGRGYNKLAIWVAAFDIRAAGIRLSGNGNPVSGSVGFSLLWEKSPACSAAVGTTCPVFVVALRSRRDSHEK